jgi:hypothetical protein
VVQIDPGARQFGAFVDDDPSSSGVSAVNLPVGFSLATAGVLLSVMRSVKISVKSKPAINRCTLLIPRPPCRFGHMTVNIRIFVVRFKAKAFAKLRLPHFPAPNNGLVFFPKNGYNPKRFGEFDSNKHCKNKRVFGWRNPVDPPILYFLVSPSSAAVHHPLTVTIPDSMRSPGGTGSTSLQ